MRLITRAFRLTNRILGQANLGVAPLSRDLDDRLLLETDERRITDALSSVLTEWFQNQEISGLKGTLNPEDAYCFYRSYLASPFRTQRGSSRLNNLLCLYALAKIYNPEIIVDSGTFEGASAWAMHLACPHAEIVSFDIDMSQLRNRMPDISYIAHDWMEHPADIFVGRRTLAYFDDHVDQARRLLEAQARGIALAVFDDDFPVTSFASMAHGGFSLPKIEFVLDQKLRESDELVWQSKGRTCRWKIDHDYLDRARVAIQATDRMPNTSLITGIHQTPYRIVSINTDS